MRAYPLPQLLDEQLDLLGRQTDLQDWKSDRHGMAQCDMNDLLALSLETFDRIKRRQPTLPADTLLAYFRRWHQIALRALAVLAHFEAQGLHVERADEFRFAINEAAMGADYRRIAAAQQRLDAGHGRSLDEILDALPPQA